MKPHQNWDSLHHEIYTLRKYQPEINKMEGNETFSMSLDATDHTVLKFVKYLSILSGIVIAIPFSFICYVIFRRLHEFGLRSIPGVFFSVILLVLINGCGLAFVFIQTMTRWQDTKQDLEYCNTVVGWQSISYLWIHTIIYMIWFQRYLSSRSFGVEFNKRPPLLETLIKYVLFMGLVVHPVAAVLFKIRGVLSSNPNHPLDEVLCSPTPASLYLLYVTLVDVFMSVSCLGLFVASLISGPFQFGGLSKVLQVAPATSAPAGQGSGQDADSESEEEEETFVSVFSSGEVASKGATTGASDDNHDKSVLSISPTNGPNVTAKEMFVNETTGTTSPLGIRGFYVSGKAKVAAVPSASATVAVGDHIPTSFEARGQHTTPTTPTSFATRGQSRASATPRNRKPFKRAECRQDGCSTVSTSRRSSSSSPSGTTRRRTSTGSDGGEQYRSAKRTSRFSISSLGADHVMENLSIAHKLIRMGTVESSLDQALQKTLRKNIYLSFIQTFTTCTCMFTSLLTTYLAEVTKQKTLYTVMNLLAGLDIAVIFLVVLAVTKCWLPRRWKHGKLHRWSFCYERFEKKFTRTSSESTKVEVAAAKPGVGSQTSDRD